MNISNKNILYLAELFVPIQVEWEKLLQIGTEESLLLTGKMKNLFNLQEISKLVDLSKVACSQLQVGHADTSIGLDYASY